MRQRTVRKSVPIHCAGPCRPRRSAPSLPAALVWTLTLALTTAGPALGAELELVGPAGAAVYLDGRAVGFLPLAPLDLPAGRYVIQSRLPGHCDFEHTVALLTDEDRARVQIRLLPLSRRTAWSSNLLLAGMGQYYLGHRTRGLVYSAVEIGGLLTALAGEIQRGDLRRDYLLLSDEYRSAINADRIAELRAATEVAYQDMQDMQDLRDTGLLVAAGAVVLSALDALLFFPGVEAGPGPVPAAAAAQPDAVHAAAVPQPESRAAVHAGLRLSF